MRLLVVQLSDIHLTCSGDPILGRIDPLAAAIASCDPSPDACILMYCGDIAYSGRDEEYALALDFILGLRAAVTKLLPSGCTFHEAFIPGNHDCDFSGALEARTMLSTSILQSKQPHVARDVIEVCVAVQKGFFDLLEALDIPIPMDQRLGFYSELKCGTEKVALYCINTAWLSRMKESQGDLFVPTNHVPSRNHDVDFAIVAMHHPYNWLESTNARELRAVLEARADLVLTGHEHQYATRDVRNEKGERSLYIEAAALQEHMLPSESAFQSITIDTSTSKQRILRHVLTDERYDPVGDPHVWEPLQSARFRASHAFPISAAFQEFLDDMGVVITHPARSSVHRRDLFTYPDLKRRLEDAKAPIQIVRGESLVDIVSETPEVVITGDEISGKSTLAKQLFEDLHGAGLVPVYIKLGDGSNWSPDTCLRQLEAAFTSQYGEDRLNAYRQQPRDLRVVIFDDFHQFRCHRSAFNGILRTVEGFAGRIVFISSELDQQLADLLYDRVAVDQGDTIRRYTILPFGHLRRNEIAERWFALDGDLAADVERLARMLLRAERMMSTAVGKNFVPPYPIFVLPMLQALAHDEQVNVGASAYGYFYESLIRRALATGGSKDRLDLHIGFLGHLARRVFTAKRSQLGEDEVMDLLKEFRERKLVDLHFSDTVNALHKSGVVVRTEGEIRFKYAYIEYYFVAFALCDTLADEATRAAIRELAETLHEERSANILLFLVHLTKDDFIIDLLLTRAREVFADIEACKLDIRDSPVLRPVGKDEQEAFEDGDARAKRREALARLDISQQSAGADPVSSVLEPSLGEAYDASHAYVQRVAVAFKTMQILGQVGVNFPGTMEGETKMQIVQESVSLGLRALGSLFGLMNEHAQGLVELSISRIRAEHPLLNEEQVIERARRNTAALPLMVAFGVIRRIAHSVGSPHLGPVYVRLMPETESAAMRLVHAVLQLDQSDNFPEEFVAELCAQLQKNPLALAVLASAVVQHMHVFEVRFDRKQRMCQLFGIAYKPLQTPKPRALLVRTRPK